MLTRAHLKLLKNFKAYLHDRSASIMMSFALALPILLGSVGMSLDMGQAYLVRQRLAGALDASALAGAAMATEQDEIAANVQEFFDLNYPARKIGTAYDLDVLVDGDEVIVSARADFDTAFMRILGIEKLTIYEESIVVREVRGLEVALVVDVTGSMSTNNNISTLRQASTSFVEILFDRTSDPEAIKIGIVPYSTSVNVGPYGVGRTPDGEDFEDGEDVGVGFVVDWNGNDLNPSQYTTNYNHTSRWYGCVVEANDDGWDDNDNSNDPYPNDVIKLRDDEDPELKILDHEGPWPIYRYENYARNASACGQTCTGSGRNRRCTDNYCHYTHTYPNTNCPRSHIVPLTSDEDELLDAISGFTAYGNTMGNIGMTWGYRVLSPEFPFQQGAPWNDTEWRKVIIMMTDGQNTMDNTYSAYWRTRRHDLGTDDQNERFLETCNQMKTAKGVLIYTVTFAGGVDDDTKDFYRQCATSPAQYYDAPSQQELIDVFETISRELANLHLRG
ncbi:MAG: pilus assembly protein [Alphaproteobacteria bacterium]|nr:pilus assembly protein [Alphaproteobacteria bacterium]